MKWPWVSRALYEFVQKSNDEGEHLLLDEISWLREELASALDKRDRIDRVEAGLGEVPHKPKVQEPMPAELAAYINAAGNTSFKRQMRGTAYRRFADGETWESIVADVIVPDEPRNLYLQAEEADEEEGAEEEAERSTTE